MPNWTYNVLKCEGITKMDIFTEQNGEKEFDFNKIIPCPEYFCKTVSPMKPKALLAYLIETEDAPVDELCRKVNEMVKKEKAFTGALFSGFFSADEIKQLAAMSAEEMSEYIREDFFLSPEENISAVELGRNYATALRETGCFDWYRWSCKYWGVKWNAQDTVINEDDDSIEFYTPWGVPMPLLIEFSKQHPDVEFSFTAFFENELPDSYSCNIKNGGVYNEKREIETLVYEEDEEQGI